MPTLANISHLIVIDHRLVMYACVCEASISYSCMADVMQALQISQLSFVH